ncbi:MAG: HAD-IIIA family hydrolase, partial [Chloroflexota bacterium]
MPDIFLDRDGVINYNRTDHVKSWEEFEFLPGSIEALVRLKRADYRVFVITNQAIINRGIVTPAELNYIHLRMLEEVSQAGGQIKAVLYCPHRPEEKCGCRKPQPGLIRLAEQEYGAQVGGSWLIGDHLDDLTAGERAGCRTMLVLSGRSTQASLEGRQLQSASDLAE